MATDIWKGDAPVVRQVDTITAAGSWSTADQIDLTIGGVTLNIIVGSDTSNAQIATAIENIMKGEAQEGTGDHTFSATASSPAFTQLTVTRSSDVVTVTGPTDGQPFTLAVVETSSGGTATETTATNPSGINAADQVYNWNNGTVPGSSDEAVWENTSVSCLYGLDQFGASMTAAHLRASYTGKLGLPLRNSAGHYEYLPRYAELDCDTVNIGEGPGDGSGRVMVNSGSNQAAINVWTTDSSSVDTDRHPVQWKGTHASNAMNVYTGGAVDVAPDALDVATLLTLNVIGGTVRASSGLSLTTAVVDAGVLSTDAAFTTLNVKGSSTVTHRAGNITTANILGGTFTVQNAAALTITTLVVANGATGSVGPSTSLTTAHVQAATLTSDGAIGTLVATQSASVYHRNGNITTATINGASTLYLRNTAALTITTLNMGNDENGIPTIDLSDSGATVTVTNQNFGKDVNINDPHGRLTQTNPGTCQQAGTPNWTAKAGSTIKVVPP